MIKAFDDIKKEVLQYLFERYMESATGHYSISHIVDAYEVSGEDIINILKQDNLIQEGVADILPTTYAITIEGINEVEPDYFADRLASIMNELGLSNTEWVNVSEVTGIHDYQRVQDIGTVLSLTEYFEIIAKPEDVMAKLTTQGWAYFEQHRKEFI